MAAMQRDPFGIRRRLDTLSGPVFFYSLPELDRQGLCSLDRLPYSIRVLIEAVARRIDGRLVLPEHLEGLCRYAPENPGGIEIPFLPARVLLQDFTGVPALVDLAAMRGAMARLNRPPEAIDPLVPVDLVIDHSVQVDVYGEPDAAEENVRREFRRNRERYEFLRWGQSAFRNLRVIPPASGICHQINLEFLARVVQTCDENGATVAFPDSLVGADSHTPTVNGLGVLGWGVGGIEAEAVMLGQPIQMLAPPVIGVRLEGELPAGATATDAVLALTERLRKYGVVGKFVEFFGPGVSNLEVPDRATLANMAPEYGATVGFFPVDEKTLAYLRETGRPEGLVELVERYCRTQCLFRDAESPEPEFEHVLTFDLGSVEPAVAGPSRPQDRIPIRSLRAAWREVLRRPASKRGFGVSASADDPAADVTLDSGETVSLRHGAVVLASITSCTNTSNPEVMIGAGLLARNAAARGLRTKPWVKTSLAPGSLVVTDYLRRAGLLPHLEALGFYLAGYGCMTCIGNSGPLPEPVCKAVEEMGLSSAAVLSGNRNFEGRISPHVRAAFLASPPLVVAFAIAGTVDIDLENEPIGRDSDGNPVFLRDIWPSADEVRRVMAKALKKEDFEKEYQRIELGNRLWQEIPVRGGALFEWNDASTYIREAPFFEDVAPDAPPIEDIRDARVLVWVGDSITTDHISPAGPIPVDSPAGRYLLERGVPPQEFNTYGSRRGNDEVMARGTFANIRLKNRLTPEREGGWARHIPSGELMTVYDAACRYREEGVPVIVLAGRDYGMGSSRDWAAKGPRLLGVRAVIAVSFERIHRSNLVGMGILPLQFEDGQNADSLGLTGHEQFTVCLPRELTPGQRLEVVAVAPDGAVRRFTVTARLDNPAEIEYYRNGGILQTVLRRLLREKT